MTEETKPIDRTPVPFATFGVTAMLIDLGMDPAWAKRAQEATIDAKGDDWVFLTVKFACPVMVLKEDKDA